MSIILGVSARDVYVLNLGGRETTPEMELSGIKSEGTIVRQPIIVW